MPQIPPMRMRTDPRIRQNLDRIHSSLEDAADSAYTSCFTFTKSYIEPCLASLAACSTACMPNPRNHQLNRHRRARQSEFPFGFYDYEDEYEEDDTRGRRDSFFNWGTDELDRLLAGSSAAPRGREVMYYGTASPPEVGGLRRKNTISGGRDSPDPTVIPTTNYFGFLGRLGFKGRGMRYKPSAANLQEHPQRGWDTAEYFAGRRRSGTGSTGSGGESLRSRGDLWPSEDEDDAVVIGDDAFPRSSDGESGRDLLLDEPEEGGRRHSQDTERAADGEETEREKERRQMIEEALSTDIGAMPIHPNGRPHRSAPPSLLATTPEPYMTERLGSSPLTISHFRLSGTGNNKYSSKSAANTIASDKDEDMTTSPNSASPMMAEVGH